MFTGFDLFAGAGGLSMGMEEAGVEIIAAVEREEDFATTLRNHLQSATIHNKDIRDVDLSLYRGKVDIVMGGPPCQPFSSGGLRIGGEDERDMMPHFLQAVSTIRPRGFLMENVRGLVVGERKKYFDKLIRDFQNLGYVVTWHILNAADYGVPQKRMRLFIVGMRMNTFSFPKPTHGPQRTFPYATVRDVLPLHQVGEANLSKVTYAKNPDLRPSPYHGLLFNGGGRPLNLDAPAPTILASAGGNKTHFIDEGKQVPPYHSHLMEGGKPRQGTLPEARRLTVEESAIIQTFPKMFTFSGPRSSQYTQVGNAVPPRLAKVLAQALTEQMQNVTAKPSPSFRKATDGGLPIPLFQVQREIGMSNKSNRNVHVEQAVNQALTRIDDFIDGEELERLPSRNHRRACDEVLKDRSASARVAGLFLAFYRLEDKSWNMKSVPTGARGKFGDKRLSNELTQRNLTLHSNITAFGENLGWKGGVSGVDLSTESHFSDWVASVADADLEEQTLIADYFASRFAQSRVVLEPLPPVGHDVLTFARAKDLFYNLLSIQSNGYIQQFLIAALLYEFRQNQGIDVTTHHPNASDKFDGTSGDIEEKKDGQLIRAYEVTMRPDWQNRISDFKSKMDSANLGKHTIPASDINRDTDWSVPAAMVLTLEKYGRDIAVIDIKDVINFLSAELSAQELRKAVNHTFDYLSNPKLCGKPEYINAYRETVDKWLDSVS